MEKDSKAILEKATKEYLQDKLNLKEYEKVIKLNPLGFIKSIRRLSIRKNRKA
jgi:hypothetical protein